MNILIKGQCAEKELGAYMRVGKKPLHKSFNAMPIAK